MGELKALHPVTNLVSQRINHLLFLNGMTQRELAMQLGVTPATVGNKMQRTARWNVDEIAEMADIFHVSTDYLLGRKPIESAEPISEVISAPEASDLASVAGAGFEPATSRL